MLIVTVGCGQPAQPSVVNNTDTVLVAYDFQNPTQDFPLPEILREISGLTALNDTLLAAVQDEKGDVFIIRTSDGEVADRFEFSKDGDFEDIEKVGEELWVLRSDGDLYRLRDWQGGDPDVKKTETFLTRRNDTEGLAYDPASRKLLVACKEDPGEEINDARAIYSFDPEERTLAATPSFLIPFSLLATSEGVVSTWMRTFVSWSDFKPSAIAVHPQTRDRWVVSSVDKSLMVFSNSGRFKEALTLPDSLYEQPEGLAFLSNGDLFISSEGQSKEARIFRINKKD